VLCFSPHSSRPQPNPIERHRRLYIIIPTVLVHTHHHESRPTVRPCRAALTLPFAVVVCYALMIVLPLLQIWWYTHENARRDRLAQTHDDGDVVDGSELEFTDKSDFERWRTFRYTM
jgi:hypothetical protein